MKKSKGFISLIVLICSASILMFISCQNKSEKKFDKLENMNWLLGNWENEMPEGVLTDQSRFLWFQKLDNNTNSYL